MIQPASGDILEAPAEALVNTVNCVGVMGRGIALQFKTAFPDNFKQYAKACKRQEVQPGRMFVTTTNLLQGPRFIINFPTKRHWRGKSRIEDIDSGLHDLARVIQELQISSIAIPPLGCGLGGLAWPLVKARILKAFEGLGHVEVYLFEPLPEASSKPSLKVNKAPQMTPGRAALVGLMHRYLCGLLDPFVTLLEVHKLMYFLQVAEEPLRLCYKPAPYGPYAENLRHVLIAIEGHFIKGYGDGGDTPEKPLTILDDAGGKALHYLSDHPITQARFQRVADLVEGFESPFGLELLATVHWLQARENPQTIMDLVRLTHAWSARKRQFSQRQIQLANTVLAKGGWVQALEEAPSHGGQSNLMVAPGSSNDPAT
ncbi:macro domain-containing protein [Cyanobium sp. FGCU-6]|nr:macro domain-containing protein [Cyanobium sp. FGCU6]